MSTKLPRKTAPSENVLLRPFIHAIFCAILVTLSVDAIFVALGLEIKFSSAN